LKAKFSVMRKRLHRSYHFKKGPLEVAEDGTVFLDEIENATLPYKASFYSLWKTESTGKSEGCIQQNRCAICHCNKQGLKEEGIKQQLQVRPVLQNGRS
jgi:hypothetical protein